jgi:hypothetical protein
MLKFVAVPSAGAAITAQHTFSRLWAAPAGNPGDLTAPWRPQLCRCDLICYGGGCVDCWGRQQLIRRATAPLWHGSSAVRRACDGVGACGGERESCTRCTRIFGLDLHRGSTRSGQQQQAQAAWHTLGIHQAQAPPAAARLHHARPAAHALASVAVDAPRNHHGVVSRASQQPPHRAPHLTAQAVVCAAWRGDVTWPCTPCCSCSCIARTRARARARAPHTAHTPGACEGGGNQAHRWPEDGHQRPAQEDQGLHEVRAVRVRARCWCGREADSCSAPLALAAGSAAPRTARCRPT